MNYLLKRDPFEVLFKNFFETDSLFNSLSSCKYEYPVDIFEDKNGLHIEIAAVGVSIENVDLTIEDGNILRVKSIKSTVKETDSHLTEYHKGITKRSFNFGWKIGKSFNIDAIEASMDKGLLEILIPYAQEIPIASRQIKINNKQITE